jgi:xylulokinase
VLADGAVVAGPVRTPYPTTFHDVRAEIAPADVWTAIVTSVTTLAPGTVDLIGLTALGPAFIAMDRAGTPLTPLVTHADRRSVEQAAKIEREVGRERHLATAGNRPYPGGIASTTWRWYAEHEPEILGRADLVGCLSTWLHRRLTGQRVIDPSQASFMGVYRTTTLGGWDPDLVAVAGGRMSQLPDIHDADQVAGELLGPAADELGLASGVPVLSGCLDGSAAMLAAAVASAAADGGVASATAGAAAVASATAGSAAAASATAPGAALASATAGAAVSASGSAHSGAVHPGLMVNSVGSTDVLAMAIDEPKPMPRLLTRALGVGRRWIAVATLASAGSAIAWAQRTLFPDLPVDDFHALATRLGHERREGSVRFRPYLAGDRTTLNQPRGGFSGLTLATTREDLLAAVLDGLAAASAARLPRLAMVGTPRPIVYVTGGAAADVMYRDWPPPPGGGEWERRPLVEATLAGAAALARAAGTAL